MAAKVKYPLQELKCFRHEQRVHIENAYDVFGKAFWTGKVKYSKKSKNFDAGLEWPSTRSNNDEYLPVAFTIGTASTYTEPGSATTVGTLSTAKSSSMISNDVNSLLSKVPILFGSKIVRANSISELPSGSLPIKLPVTVENYPPDRMKGMQRKKKGNKNKKWPSAMNKKNQGIVPENSNFGPVEKENVPLAKISKKNIESFKPKPPQRQHVNNSQGFEQKNEQGQTKNSKTPEQPESQYLEQKHESTSPIAVYDDQVHIANFYRAIHEASKNRKSSEINPTSNSPRLDHKYSNRYSNGGSKPASPYQNINGAGVNKNPFSHIIGMIPEDSEYNYQVDGTYLPSLTPSARNSAASNESFRKVSGSKTFNGKSTCWEGLASRKVATLPPLPKKVWPKLGDESEEDSNQSNWSMSDIQIQLPQNY